MITIYILCALLLVLTTVMFVLFFINDKAQRKKIKRLNKKISYYINVLERKGRSEEMKEF